MKMDTADLEAIVNDGHSSPPAHEEHHHQAESNQAPSTPPQHQSQSAPPNEAQQYSASRAQSQAAPPAEEQRDAMPSAPGASLNDEDLSEDDLAAIERDRRLLREKHPDIPPPPEDINYATEKVHDVWSDGSVEKWDKQFTELSKK